MDAAYYTTALRAEAHHLLSCREGEVSRQIEKYSLLSDVGRRVCGTYR